MDKDEVEREMLLKNRKLALTPGWGGVKKEEDERVGGTAVE
jgi:hypothetical protein